MQLRNLARPPRGRGKDQGGSLPQALPFNGYQGAVLKWPYVNPQGVISVVLSRVPGNLRAVTYSRLLATIDKYSIPFRMASSASMLIFTILCLTVCEI